MYCAPAGIRLFSAVSVLKRSGPARVSRDATAVGYVSTAVVTPCTSDLPPAATSPQKECPRPHIAAARYQFFETKFPL